MMVFCRYFNGLPCRFKNVKINYYYHDFNFRLKIKHDFKNNKHKHLIYFGKNYKRYDNKLNKISYHEFKKNLR